jgi:hypothetical protein
MLSRMGADVDAALTWPSSSAAVRCVNADLRDRLLKPMVALLAAAALLVSALAHGGATSGASLRHVEIAGVAVALCEGGGGDGKGSPKSGHACDQCCLRLADALPQALGESLASPDGRPASHGVASTPPLVERIGEANRARAPPVA